MEEPEEYSQGGQERDPEPPSGDERLQHFITMLSDDDEMNRWKAAETLGRIGDRAAVGPLIDTLWDEDARVRLKAAWALGRIGEPDALRPLQRLYRMEREDAQEIIEEALAGIKRTLAGSR